MTESFHVVAQRPMAPERVSVVSKKGSPSFQEPSGASFWEGKVDLWTLHAPSFVAFPLMDAFRTSPQPRYAEISIW
ncbi:hypothetical protein [Streptomyces lydicus]|uniref:hypothetical protein n=1 Tax=Streptomyces lydicus TaxID=47763 RepID=UPI003791E090